MVDLEMVSGYVPGSIGRVVEMHGDYYAEHWGFGRFFEAKVATELADFLSTFDPKRDGFWTMSADGRVEAALAIDGSRASSDGAHLRWFIVSATLRGQGVGGRLISKAMSFCRDRGYPHVYLWTFGGLDAARHLYEREGFRLTEERLGNQWGTEVLEQRFDYRLVST